MSVIDERVGALLAALRRGAMTPLADIVEARIAAAEEVSDRLDVPKIEQVEDGLAAEQEFDDVDPFAAPVNEDSEARRQRQLHLATSVVVRFLEREIALSERIETTLQELRGYRPERRDQVAAEGDSFITEDVVLVLDDGREVSLSDRERRNAIGRLLESWSEAVRYEASE